MQKQPAARRFRPTGSILRIEMLEERRVLSIAPWWQQVLVHHYQTTEPVAAQTSLVFKPLPQNEGVLRTNVKVAEQVSIQTSVATEPTPVAETTTAEAVETESAPVSTVTKLAPVDQGDQQPIVVSIQSNAPTEAVVSEPVIEKTLPPRQLAGVLGDSAPAPIAIQNEIPAERPVVRDLPIEAPVGEESNSPVVRDVEKPGPFERPAEERFVHSPAPEASVVLPESPSLASLPPPLARTVGAVVTAIQERDQDDPVVSPGSQGPAANPGRGAVAEVTPAASMAPSTLASLPRTRDSQGTAEAGTDLASAEIANAIGDMVFSEVGSEEETPAADVSAEPQEAGLMEEGQLLDGLALDAAVQQLLSDVQQLGEQSGEMLSDLEVSALAAVVVVGAVGWGAGRRFRRKQQPAHGLGALGGGSTLTWMPDGADC